MNEPQRPARAGIDRWLTALLVLAVAFVTFSQAVALGSFRFLDRRVESSFQPAWQPVVGLVAQAFSLLGGPEISALVALGLFVYLRRRGLRWESWALLAYPIGIVLELFYKRLLVHPEPPPLHADGPSLSMLVEGGAGIAGNSYPSGHMLRTVLVYGLLAFVVHRLAPPGWPRRLAVPAAAVIIAAMALDRLYLGVHWESDVVGGAFLGGLLLCAAVSWLDRAPAP